MTRSSVLVVSHRRSGTNLLCALLHRNLATGAEDYHDLHYSHSKLPPVPFVTVSRPVLPVMLSMWRMRVRFGVRQDVSFQDFIRLPFPSLLGPGELEQVHDGTRCDDERGPFQCEGCLPAKWREDTARFNWAAAASVEYHHLLENPGGVVRYVAERLCVPCGPKFQPVFERVGWWAANEEHPEVTWDDLVYLDRFSLGQRHAFPGVQVEPNDPG